MTLIQGGMLLFVIALFCFMAFIADKWERKK